VILNVGGVIDVTAWRDDADAILLAWQGGQESGNAVAGILSGKINPSGKLTTTFPMSYDDVPSAKNFPGKNLSTEEVKGIGGFSMGYKSEVSYEEGIYTGYRYYNTFNIIPAYAFGYGLSYTTFSYSDLKLSSATFNGEITATVTITNSGNVAGKEVVQLYINAPGKKMDKPAIELKGFAKTNLLQPGKSQTISFVISAKDLASFDTNRSSWIAEDGKYLVMIGASSINLPKRAGFSVPEEIIVEKCNKVLAPQVPINELRK